MKSQLTRLDHMCYSSKKSGKVSKCRNVVQAVRVIVAETRVFKLRGVLKLPLVDFLKAFDMYTRQLLPKLEEKKNSLTAKWRELQKDVLQRPNTVHGLLQGA